MKALIPKTVMKKVHSTCKIPIGSRRSQRYYYGRAGSILSNFKPHPPSTTDTLTKSRNESSRTQKNRTLTLYKVKDKILSKAIHSKKLLKPPSMKTPFGRKSTIISKPVVTPELNVIKKSETAHWVLKRKAPKQLGHQNESKRLINEELIKQLFKLWDTNKAGKITINDISTGLNSLNLAENSTFTQKVTSD